VQYMLLCRFDERRWDSLPEATRDAIMRDYEAWIAEMHRLGKHRASAQLASPSSGRTVRSAGPGRNVVDGPFAETKEQLGGYHVLECSDIDEALALAARIPTLPHGGAIEVRAVERPA